MTLYDIHFLDEHYLIKVIFCKKFFLLQLGTAVVKSGRLKLAQTYGPIVLPHIYTDKKKYTFRIYLSDFTGWGSFHVFQF